MSADLRLAADGLAELRLGDRLRNDGGRWVVDEDGSWVVAMLYRPDRLVLIDRDGERQMVDWPETDAPPPRASRRGRPSPEERRRRAEERRYAIDEATPCLVCGTRLHCLPRHLSAAHGIDSREYRRRFPGAPLASPHFRAVSADLMVDRIGPTYWTDERIIAAIQRWAREHDGEPPRMQDWGRGGTSLDRGVWGTTSRSRPTRNLVVIRFGTWGAALAAAGFEPRGRGFPVGTKLNRRYCPNGHRYRPEDVRPDGSRRCSRCRARKIAVTCPGCGRTRNVQWRAERRSGVVRCRPCGVRASKPPSDLPPIVLTCPDCGLAREVARNGGNLAAAAAGGVRRCRLCARRARAA